MHDTGLWLLFGVFLLSGLAAGIVLTLLYLRDKDEDIDAVWADFFANGVQPRAHHNWRPRGS